MRGGEWERRGGKGKGRDEPPLSKSWIRRWHVSHVSVFATRETVAALSISFAAVSAVFAPVDSCDVL